MKEITILSGKGGTGKTSVSAAFASFTEKIVICDSDVDAPDLHLILHPIVEETHVFPGGWIVSIDTGICSQCGLCKEYCRFHAIHVNSGGNHYINPVQCEGCRLCERVCPVSAISSTQSMHNSWYVSGTRFGKLVHAKMGPGEENSGKLVTIVRKRAKELAKTSGAGFIITDGPPGIGCAAIASVTGAQAVIMVIEPTRSGLHDAGRLAELVENFKIPAFAIINKYDINEEVSVRIESWLRTKNIPLIGKIPFSKSMVEAIVEGKTIIELNPDSEIAEILKKSWLYIVSSLDDPEKDNSFSALRYP
jgi:MinD superfamily P-loop ATPase